jgi:hypothetical protein
MSPLSHLGSSSSARGSRSGNGLPRRGIRQAFSAICLYLAAYGTMASLPDIGSCAHAQVVEENQVKAAYLYNFAKFVEWPAAAFPNPDDPVQICAIGDDAAIDVLQAAVSGKKAHGRPVLSRRLSSIADLGTCHILFVGFRDKHDIATILRRAESAAVLTVGQSDQFIPLGGMINLANKNGAIELEVAPAVAEDAGLKISSRLLVVARVVTADARKGER